MVLDFSWLPALTLTAAMPQIVFPLVCNIRPSATVARLIQVMDLSRLNRLHVKLKILPGGRCFLCLPHRLPGIGDAIASSVVHSGFRSRW